jgi:hypothetical protein
MENAFRVIKFLVIVVNNFIIPQGNTTRIYLVGANSALTSPAILDQSFMLAEDKIQQ